MTPPPESTFHSIIRAPIAAANGRVLPILVLEDGSVFTPGVEWLCTGKLLSLAPKTLSDAVQALGLLYDYYCAAYKRRVVNASELDRMLVAFGEAVLHGTINQNGDCPFGLYWRGRPDRAVRLAQHVQRFCAFVSGERWDHCADHADDGLLPKLRQSWGCVVRRYDGSLLAHLAHARRTERAPALVRSRTSHAVDDARPTPFPSEYVLPLITEGCRRERRLSDRSLPEVLRTYNVRDVLAFLLLIGGGLRTEELFHIFSNDIYAPENDGKVRVNLYHPVRGAITWTPLAARRPTTTSREIFLKERYGLTPRNLYDDRHPLWAGWKGLLLTHGAPRFYAQVFWIHPFFGQLFWGLHDMYMKHIRLPCGNRHPYYFVSLGRSSMGDPWTVGSFQEAWQKALKRIGLTQNRLHGTNPHAARHWYGQRAADMGIDPRIRQVMMHHRSIISQLRYQRPSAEQVNDHIDLAHKRMSASVSVSLRNDGDDLVVSNFDELEMDRLLTVGGGTGPGFGILDQLSQDYSDPAGVMSSWRFYSRGMDRGAPR